MQSFVLPEGSLGYFIFSVFFSSFFLDSSHLVNLLPVSFPKGDLIREMLLAVRCKDFSCPELIVIPYLDVDGDLALCAPSPSLPLCRD